MARHDMCIRLKSGREFRFSCEEYTIKRHSLTQELAEVEFKDINGEGPIFFKTCDIESISEYKEDEGTIDEEEQDEDAACRKEWIRCEDRLPDIGDTYLVSGRMKYKQDKEYDYFTDAAIYLPITGGNYPLGNTGGTAWATWNDWYEGQDEYEIIAWMELPEPCEERRGK